MKQQVNPLATLHYDIVGSFLRPANLKQARQAFADHKISASDLKQVEDQAIIDLLKQEADSGLKVVTDGEFRRSWWHLDFFWGLNGLQKAQAQTGYQFHDEQTRNETVNPNGLISGKQHPFVEHFKFTQEHTPANLLVKQTIPAPSQLLAELSRPENQASVQQFYPHEDKLLQDITTAYQQVLTDLANAGCRLVQLDDCSWGQVIDWTVHQTQTPARIAQIKQQFVDLNNAVIACAPPELTINTHICRGNYHSTWFVAGGYESVADVLFKKEQVQSFYLEYDTKRAGSLEPIQAIPADTRVVLGLVTSKSGQLEDQAQLIQRLQVASQYHPLENLALSPQCGFASTEEGNILTEQQQWAKIQLLQDVAREVWGA